MGTRGILEQNAGVPVSREESKSPGCVQRTHDYITSNHNHQTKGVCTCVCVCVCECVRARVCVCVCVGGGRREGGIHPQELYNITILVSLQLHQLQRHLQTPACHLFDSSNFKVILVN